MDRKRVKVTCTPLEHCSAFSCQRKGAPRDRSHRLQRLPGSCAFLIRAARGVTSRSTALPLADLATRRSYTAWRRSQSSGSPPKYRASLKAVSAVTPRLSSRISLIRGAVTPRAFASAVALSPAGSIKSLRRICPGCGGCVVFLVIGRHTPPPAATPATALERYPHIPYNGIRYRHRGVILTESSLVGEFANPLPPNAAARLMPCASAVGNSNG